VPVSSWSRYRALSLHLPSLGVAVDLSKASLPDDALTRDPLVSRGFPEAFAAMEALEHGALASPDRNRMVGHYWLRTPQLAPDPAIRAVIEATVAQVKTFAADVAAGQIAPSKGPRFRNLLVIATGGPALGAQLLADALRTPSGRLRPFFFDGTDPDGMVRELSRIDASGGLAMTLTAVVSDAGATEETMGGMFMAADAYRRTGLDFGRHAVAITRGRTELDAIAAREHWLARFPVWDWVDDRTCITSAAGLLPAALVGIDVVDFLAGAAAMDETTRDAETARNPAALLALGWYRATDLKGRKDMAVLPYKDRLQLFPAYLQHLVMESLGKGTNITGREAEEGIVVWGTRGSPGRHPLFRQLREGLANFLVTFIDVARDREDGLPSLLTEPDVTPGDSYLGLLLAARRALAEKGRPSITVTIPDVSPRSLGMLIALFERTVGLYASLVGVNAYDPPAILVGKRAAAPILDLQRKALAELRARAGSFRTAEEIAAAIGAETETEAVFRLLAHLAANPARGVVRRDGKTPFDAEFRTP
jgi:glucose-6-phosphate isomerase